VIVFEEIADDADLRQDAKIYTDDSVAEKPEAVRNQFAVEIASCEE
jgi:hypothetical protein